MNLQYGTSQVMHRIRVKLYPNYLPGHENSFLARTDSEAVLSVEQVCAAMLERGGFKGNPDDLVTYVKAFLKESAYQLSDGFAVNNDWYSIHPNLGGTFRGVHDHPDPKRHPLTFRFRPLSLMRKLAESIAIIVEGEADASGWIDEFRDSENDSINHMYEPGNQFILTGSKIRIAGEDPSCGMFFVPEGDDSPAVQVTRIAENTAGKIIGVIPSTAYAFNRIEIRTQFSGSTGTMLKKPRVIKSKFVLEHV